VAAPTPPGPPEAEVPLSKPKGGPKFNIDTDAFWRNVSQRLLDVHSAETVTEPKKITIGGQTVRTLPGAFDNPRTLWDVKQSQVAPGLKGIYNVPVGRAYGPDGLPVDWDYRKEVYGPNGDPLPPGATSWDAHGRPYYGNNDYSIWGDIRTEFDATFARFNQPIRPTGGVKAFSADFWEALKPMFQQNPFEEGGKPIGRVVGTVFGEAAAFLEQSFVKAQNDPTGVQPVDTILSGISKTLTSAIRVVFNAFQAPSLGWERAWGTALLANQIAAEKSSLPDLPQLGGWAGKIQSISTPQIFWNSIRTAQAAISDYDVNEWRDIGVAAGQASRIAYTLASDRAKREEFIRRYQNEDPRLLAVELEDPAMEAIGQTLNDPTILFGLVHRALKGGSAATQAARVANDARWATAADNIVVEGIRTFDGSADNLDDIIAKTQGMYEATRANMTREAATRGITAPTAGAKRFVHGEDVGSFYHAMSARFGEDQDGFMNFLDGLVMAADPSDKAVVLEGIDNLSRAGIPLETVMSDPANRTAVVLRNMLTDADGTINPAKTLFADLGEAAGDAAKLSGIATRRMDGALERIFPTVQEQADAHKKFLTLLEKSPEEAAAFLERNPGAKNSISRGLLRIANTHDTMQKGYNVFRGAMAFAYMATSPAYWLRNRISNAIHIGVDMGIGVGLKAFYMGSRGAEDELVRMFSYLPSAAGLGFGAGAEAPEAAKGFLGKLNRLAAAAADEKGMRQIVMGEAARREFNKVLRPGVVIPFVDDAAPLAEHERALLYQLARDNYGDARKAAERFRQLAELPHGRNLGFLTRTQQEALQANGLLDKLNELIGLDDLDAATKGWDEVLPAIDTIAEKTAIEAPAIDLASLTPLERTAIQEGVSAIQENAGDKAADIFSRQIWSNEVALQQGREAANDMHRLAYRNHFQRVLSRLAAENNGKLPMDTIVRQADDIAQREIDGVMKAFDTPIENVNRDLVRRAQSFTELAHSASEASKNKGFDVGKWMAVLGIPESSREIYEPLLREKGFRGWLWGPRGKGQGYYHQAVHEMWIARREGVIAAIEEKTRFAATLAGENLDTEAVHRAEESLRVARLFDDARIGKGSLAYVLDDAGKKIPIVAPYDGFTPSTPRVAYETRRGLRQLHAEVREAMAQAWSSMPPPEIRPGLDEFLNKWIDEGMNRVTTARLNIEDVAAETAKFTLHAYPQRQGFDLALGYIYPFQYWYTRTYIKWLRRMVSHPEIIAAYARYRTYMEKKNAALPEWWRYNIRVDEMFGVDLKDPLYFNLESTLNPLNALVGTDFNDPQRRVDWLSSVMDDLNKFGPTVWTPYQLALALGYHIQGKQEAAARWGGRLAQSTGALRDVTALMGANQGKGIEVDPAVLLFGGGLTPYERNRAGRELGGLMNEGVSEKDAIQAAYDQEGPIWDLAVSRAINSRALGNIASFLVGVGFKPRTDADIQIDQMFAHRNAVMAMKHLMSPEEYRSQWEQLRQAYPFMEAVLLARKGGDERDEAFAYNVLGRIPPGMTDNVAEAMGLDYSIIQSFYDNKGITGMAEGDRLKFMSAIMDMGAMMEVPPTGTRAEWNEARKRNSAIYDRIETFFGSDIWDRVDVYYGLKNEGNQDAAYALLDQDPEIELALSLKSMYVQEDPVTLAYYGSIGTLDSYWRGRMYYEIEKKTGPDIWSQWTEYFSLPERSAERRAYWREHPDLQIYVDTKAGWMPFIADKLVEFGSKIQESAPIFSGAPESAAQRNLAEFQPQRGFPQLSAAQWEDELGPSLYRLTLDAARGEVLPSRLQDKLEEKAVEMGLPENAWLMVELVARSAIAPQQALP